MKTFILLLLVCFIITFIGFIVYFGKVFKGRVHYGWEVVMSSLVMSIPASITISIVIFGITHIFM